MTLETSIRSKKKAVAASQNLKERDYWLNKLSGNLVKSYFPYDFRVTRSKEILRKEVDFRFSKELSINLEKLSNRSEHALHVILLTGIVALLGKHTGNRDIIVGTPIYKQEEEGEFINTILPLRCWLEKDKTFKELLLHVRETVVEAVENQNYPVESLLHKLILAYVGFGFPLLDIVVLLDGLHDKRYIGDFEFNMIFSFAKKEKYIAGVLEYNALLYEKATVTRIISHLNQFFLEALSDVDSAIFEIDLLAEEERNQLLFKFNDTKRALPNKRTIHHFVEEYARNTPEKIAIVYNDQTLTYFELNEKSNQLARLLRDSDITRDQTVGILLNRSHVMVESILAVWKAGGAYIPLNSKYPVQRLIAILKDSGTNVLITQTHYIDEMLESEYQGKIIKLDLLEHEIRKRSSADLDLAVEMSDLAYVIYTSGSTGKPKGAMIEHRGMMNHIHSKIFDLCLSEQSIIAQNASHTFDISVWQFFTTLTLGAKTIIYPDELIFTTEQFLEKIHDDRVTVLEVVPSYLSVILDLIDSKPINVNHLEYLLVTGEVIKPSLVQRWFNRFPEIKMVNAYGPTEASDRITHYVMDCTPNVDRIPIGKPLSNLKIHIVDENMRLCPVGVKGEICVSGVGVGRGYLNDESRTKEVFIEDPFTTEIGVRMYKTGDLGCWRSDGNIDFLGRKDHQIKIRGFRIELGEIESEIVKHHSVKEAVVIDREGKNGDKYLCAYLVSDNVLDFLELKTFLSERLPEYMIPTYFFRLEKFPLTISSKVDRQALSMLEDVPNNSVQYLAPRNEIEKTLSEIWEKVLGREKIGIDENFFLLGGDSIKSIQIISRLRTTGYKLEMRDIFRFPYISKLSPLVRKLDRTAVQSPITGVTPLTPAQKQFFVNHRVERHYYNQALMLYSEEGFKEEVIRQVVEKLQEHHDILRMSYQEKDGKIVQINHGLEYPYSLRICDLRKRDHARELFESTVNEIQSSIDLANGPLMKLGLFHHDDGDRLLIVIHHLIIDGVSWRILLEDMNALLAQAVAQERFELPPKTDSFKLWAEKLNEYTNSESFLKESSYWMNLESTSVPLLQKDFLADNYVKDAVTVSFSLDEEATNLLLTKVNDAFGTEINDVLLTALGLGINKSFGLGRVLIALEGHGREEILTDVDVSRTLGWFTCIFPVLLNMSHANRLSRQLKEVKESLRRLPDRGIGYGILRYLTTKQHGHETNFKLKPQISFNYLGEIDAVIDNLSFQLAEESVGNSVSPNAEREYELDVSGILINKKLIMEITYSKNQYKEETIMSLLSNYEAELKRIIWYCSTQEKRETTPSDFLYDSLTIEELDSIFD